ncbi:antitoxin [Terrabacter sp. NPDC080008]|uniref:antitoxin n=1 Tax=Terrabacter sp. NPDC080008 TaxID=3155176 RepID=UPI00344B271B
MSFGEQMKHKADEVHFQEKAKDFGDALVEMARTAMSAAAGYAHENRGRVDGALDKAEAKISEKTGGKHADTVTKVRASVDKGIDKLVEQHDHAAPPSAGVPDDKHSAFDEDPPAGNPM